MRPYTFNKEGKRHRCLVLAAGWYESTGDKPPKRPYLFKQKNGRPFAFAGIWMTRKVGDDWIATVAILTTEVDELSAPIHNRMPLVLDPLAYDAWVWPNSEPQDYRSVNERPDDAEYEVFPVSRAVNSPKDDLPELVERAYRGAPGEP